MYSDDEGYQQHSQYSKHRSRRSSGSAERDSETRRRSRSRSHIPIERPPRQPRSRDYRLRPTSTSPSREYAQYPPSIVPEGHVPRGLPFKYSAARMTQRQLDMEDKEMRREDDLNRRRQDEAKGNKRLEESRSRSRRRSYGAFSRPQQYSGEGEIPVGERYHYRQPRRSPAPSGSSKGGYHGDAEQIQEPRTTRRPDRSERLPSRNRYDGSSRRRSGDDGTHDPPPTLKASTKTEMFKRYLTPYK